MHSPLCLPHSTSGVTFSVGGRKALRLRPLRMQTSGDEGSLDGEKYTEKAFAIMQKLAGIADRFKQQYIEAELLLYASLQDETVQKIVSKAAGKGAFSSMMQQLVQDVEKFINSQPKVSGGQGQKLMGRWVRALRDHVCQKVSPAARDFHFMHAKTANKQTGTVPSGLPCKKP